MSGSVTKSLRLLRSRVLSLFLTYATSSYKSYKEPAMPANLYNFVIPSWFYVTAGCSSIFSSNLQSHVRIHSLHQSPTYLHLDTEPAHSRTPHPGPARKSIQAAMPESWPYLPAGFDIFVSSFDFCFSSDEPAVISLGKRPGEMQLTRILALVKVVAIIRVR